MDTQSKPKFSLVGCDGNAFAILGGWQKAARKAGWTAEQIKTVMDDARLSDYNHLLTVIQDNCE